MTTTTKKVVTKTIHYKTTPNWYEVLLPERTFTDTMGNNVYYPPVCRTTDYSMLEDLLGQRETTPSHLKKLIASIETLNCVNREIIVVKYHNSYTMADGKHLFFALVQKGLPIEFKLIEVSNLKDAVAIMRKMNSTSRNWTLHQFVNSMAVINKDYAKLKSYYIESGITMNLLGALMFNNKKLNTAKSNSAIKEGTFQMNTSVKDMELLFKRIKNFYTITNLDDNQYCNVGLCTFMISKSDTYSVNEKNFLNKVKAETTKRKFIGKSFGKNKEYLQFFNECWNEL
jgi:hypothetical protein